MLFPLLLFTAGCGDQTKTPLPPAKPPPKSELVADEPYLLTVLTEIRAGTSLCESDEKLPATFSLAIIPFNSSEGILYFPCNRDRGLPVIRESSYSQAKGSLNLPVSVLPLKSATAPATAPASGFQTIVIELDPDDPTHHKSSNPSLLKAFRLSASAIVDTGLGELGQSVEKSRKPHTPYDLMARIAAYIRVSTEKQNTVGQKEEIETWLLANGYDMGQVDFYLCFAILARVLVPGSRPPQLGR